MNVKEIMVGLHLKAKGDWLEIFSLLSSRTRLSDEEIEKAQKFIKETESNGKRIITIMDKDYPEELKTFPHPPFVLIQ